MLPLTVCPATCELCGNWLPQHQTSCPRNGVHPSQWSCSLSEPITVTSEEQQQLGDNDYATLFTVNEQDLLPTTIDFYL